MMSVTITIPRQNGRAGTFLPVGINGKFYWVPIGVSAVVPDEVAEVIGALGITMTVMRPATGEVIIPTFYGSRVAVGLNGKVSYLRTGVSFLPTAQQLAALLGRGICLVGESEGGIDPTPVVAQFAVAPTITGGTIRTVGDVFAYDPGTVLNGSLGSVTLRRDGVQAKVLSGGSDMFTAAGTYLIRSTIAGTSISADSSPVTVFAAVASPITAPNFAFETGRVAGTNPPVIVWDDPDDTVYATDTLEIEWTTGGVTYSKQIAMDISIRSTHEIALPEWATLPAGAFSVRGRYRRTTDIDGNPIALVLSAWGSPASDTLGAKTLPAATTTWDLQNKAEFLQLDNVEYLNATGQNVGGDQPVLTTIARSDKRFAEMKVIAYDPASSFQIGISPANGVAANYSIPSGSIKADIPANGHALNDVFTLLVTPQVGGTPGRLVVQRNGVEVYNVTHGLTDYKLLYSPRKQTSMRLNTGKEAFSFAPTDTTYVRYN